MCIRDRLESAIVNLANNARDAMPDGGRLRIATSNRRLDADYAATHSELVEGEYVLIEVSDTGTGMTPEVLEQVFEPFFTTKPPGEGTGLGLAMVFGFIKQSAGHINVSSEPGIGTTFRLYFPRVSDRAEERSRISTVEAERSRGETILIVEDNQVLRRVAVRQLQALGYRTLEAEEATAALAILEQHPVDLLFTDIVMPGPMGGMQLAEQARERWPALRVLLTSGFPGQIGRPSQEPLAATRRLLSKPYREKELASVLREIFDEDGGDANGETDGTYSGH